MRRESREATLALKKLSLRKGRIAEGQGLRRAVTEQPRRLEVPRGAWGPAWKWGHPGRLPRGS